MADDLSKIVPEFNKPLSEVLPQQTQGSLEDFSGVPDFIICSTDLRTGEGFYFSKYHVGHLTPNVKSRFSALPHVYKGDATGAKLASKVTLATAIASSASYPAAFQPMVIEVEPAQGGPSFDICVSDGGVHDNVGLDPAINYALPHPYGKCGVLFVSDAGAPLKPRTFPKIQLAFPIPLISSIHIIYAQINVLRFKQQEALIQNMNTCGCWWKVDDLADPNAHKKFPEWFQSYIDEDVVLKLMNFRTDLNKFTENEKKILENVGYGLCTISISKHALVGLKEIVDSETAFKRLDCPPKLPNSELTDAKEIEHYMKDSDSILRADLPHV